MEENDIPVDMPMHYAYFRKNEDCNLPYGSISPIPHL